MDLFVRNLPPQTTDNDLKRFFNPLLKKFGIHTSHYARLRNKGCAIITILSEKECLDFLSSLRPSNALIYHGRQIICQISRNKPDEWLVKSLEKAENDRLRLTQAKQSGNPTTKSQNSRARGQYAMGALACGLWDYINEDLVFVKYAEDGHPGFHSYLTFDQWYLHIILQDSVLEEDCKLPIQRLDVHYSIVNTTTAGSQNDPTLTFSLNEAPRMYEKVDSNKPSNAPSPFQWKRITNLNASHAPVVATCRVYRITLARPEYLQTILKHEARTELLPITRWPARTIVPQVSFARERSNFTETLTKTFHEFSFGLQFQLQRLYQNGALPPRRVLELLPTSRAILKRSGDRVTTQVLRSMVDYIPYPGPGVDAANLTVAGLGDFMKETEGLINRTENRDDDPSLENLALIYKATVTPAGLYLNGPDHEVSNRVLRKYADSTTYFLRVSFLEENGEPVRSESGTSNEEIFAKRFKSALSGTISVAGRSYGFLGYSHSSLRSQTCWFMAPFVHNGSLLLARALIAKLGDFTNIRSPARAAARVGQAFSDTHSAIPIPKGTFRKIRDVERNGRTFSDGVGTISRDLIEKIWEQYKPDASLKATIYQIRYAGAKGMISLDTTLQGKQLKLRKSMIKFPSDASDIEICEGGEEPRPMFLNRPLIKILEDLDVPYDCFQALQDDYVERLRRTTLSAKEAANFLQSSGIGTSAHIPMILKRLELLGLPFQGVDFLRDVVEMAVLMALREVKHRARIPVSKGVSLFGIMDETGYLKEGQVYCTVKSKKSRSYILTGRVVVTRSPALHPGDVQLADAVRVPVSSPLRALHNCIVFSQFGDRDLPSQLSGGDLDGDIYNVIWDVDLQPTQTFSPADYPRVTPLELDRPVEIHDMATFFLQFMQNDQLGRIAKLHQIIADQSDQGTLDDRCLELADMHSTAVDFSKSGIPVDISQLPPHQRNYRPDFLAPGLEVTIEKNLEVERLKDDEAAEDSVFSKAKVLSHRFYESQKTLGKLYRSINEARFCQELKSTSTQYTKVTKGSVLSKLWKHVLREATGISWQCLQNWARDIKESYETNLRETMQEYSSSFYRPLDELEVFVGIIIGTRGTQTKRQKETSKEMREKMERDVAWIIEQIVGRKHEEIDPAASLARALACMSLTVLKPESGLRSWTWIAAGTCLRELERWKIDESTKALGRVDLRSSAKVIKPTGHAGEIKRPQVTHHEVASSSLGEVSPRIIGSR
ncbi:hypothetical protein MMC25_005890 [Agyrium rufum]|nr:hypothetical protein [Agyrium rufum]